MKSTRVILNTLLTPPLLASGPGEERHAELKFYGAAFVIQSQLCSNSLLHLPETPPHCLQLSALFSFFF